MNMYKSNNMPANLCKAEHYFRTVYGAIVVCGWNDRGTYRERQFIGYTLKEVRKVLSSEGVRGAWTFGRYGA